LNYSGEGILRPKEKREFYEGGRDGNDNRKKGRQKKMTGNDEGEGRWRGKVVGGSKYEYDESRDK
jgi:hypothetical protein